MKTLLAVLRIVPLLLTLVRAVEEAIPLPGQGKKKLDLVLDVIKAGYDGSAGLPADLAWPRLVVIIVAIVERIVAVHNELGLFQTKTTEPAKS